MFIIADLVTLMGKQRCSFLQVSKIDFNYNAERYCTEKVSTKQHRYSKITLVNVNAPVVATTSWWLHFSAPVVA